MRILMFSTDDHLYPAAGAEQAFGHITKRMPEVEFDLICAKLRKGVKGYEKVGNINIYRMGLGIPKVDGIILALFGHVCAYKLMKKHTYDLVWSIMASYGAFSAVRVKKKTGIPFLLTLQEGDSFDHIYRRVRFVRKSFNDIFKYADGLQAISTFLLTWGKEMGFQGKVAEVIPNAVDVGVFLKEFSREEIKETRTSFGFKEPATILITSSRLERKNGIGDVVKALTNLPENVCFVICGSGSLEEKIKADVISRNLQGRVKFMGFVDPSALPLLMRASDIFIRPSVTEGLGNAFLEAMASRLITVGTNAGGIPDFLTQGKTGFMVEIESPESIAATIVAIQSMSDAERDVIRAQARAMVIERYTWEVVTNDMRTLFATLTDTKI